MRQPVNAEPAHIRPDIIAVIAARDGPAPVCKSSDDSGSRGSRQGYRG